MDIAIGLPNAVPGTTGEQLVEWARRGERRGFSSLGTIDRITYGSYESLIALSGAAAVTERIGLVSEVVADAAALQEAHDRIAAEILACAPGAVADCKRLAADVYGREIDHELMDMTARRIAAARVGEEGQEGVHAFLERRRPRWAAEDGAPG